jgi:uncharacterized protein (TIGR02246 family)
MSLKDEIQAAQNQLAQAIAARDAGAAAALYTPDACLMPDGMPSCTGHETIGGFFGGAIENGIVAARFTTLDVEADGGFAVETGRYELFAAHPSGDRIRADAGRYLVVWRQVEGSWRIHRDMFNRPESKA